MPGGRPRNHNADEVAEIQQQFAAYIAETEIPILAEFAYTHDIPRQTLYDYEEFSTLRKLCIDKKEAQLERKALNGDVNTTMAIFSLKQLGWSDRQDHNVSGNLGVNIVDDIPKGATDEGSA